LDHVSVVNSPDKSSHQHTSPHVDPLHPAPRAASLGPGLGTCIPQENSDQSNPRAYESDHTIEADRPQLCQGPHWDASDSAPRTATAARLLAPGIGTHIPQNHSDTMISPARESDHAVAVDKRIFEQPATAIPCPPLDPAGRSAMSSHPVAVTSPTTIAQHHSYTTSSRAHQSDQPIVDSMAPNAVEHRHTDAPSPASPLIDYATPTTQELSIDLEPSVTLRPVPNNS
jgi:hypothetical protein